MATHTGESSLLGKNYFITKYGWDNEWTENPQELCGVIPTTEFTVQVCKSLEDLLEISQADMVRLILKIVKPLHDDIKPTRVKTLLERLRSRKRGSKAYKAQIDLADGGECLFFEAKDYESVQQGLLSSQSEGDEGENRPPSSNNEAAVVGDIGDDEDIFTLPSLSSLVLRTPQSACESPSSTFTDVTPKSGEGTPSTIRSRLSKSAKTNLENKMYELQRENSSLKSRIETLEQDLKSTKLALARMQASHNKLKRKLEAADGHDKPKSARMVEADKKETMCEWNNLIDLGASAAAKGLGSVEVVVPKGAKGKLFEGQKGVMGGEKDYIVIDQRFPGNDNIFVGQEYFGMEKNSHRGTTGNKNIYVLVKRHIDEEDCSSRRTLKRKTTLLRQVLSLLVGTSWDGLVQENAADDFKVGIFLAKMLQSNTSLGDRVVENLGLVFPKKLTGAQSVELRISLGLTMRTLRTMRIILNKFGANILASERKMRAEQEKLLIFLQSAKMTVKKVLMCSGKPGIDSAVTVDVLMCQDLEGYIRGVFSDILKKGNTFFSLDATQPEKNFVHIVFSGDKGGETMKFHFKIVHPETNVFDSHLICFYKGSDKMAALGRVLPAFRQQLQVMRSTEYRLLGYKVVLFRGGDLKFLDATHGHQGSSATYPSPNDDCTIQHLRKHGGAGHTPELCTDIHIRSTEELTELYNQNLADDEGGEDDLEGVVGDSHSDISEDEDVSESEDESLVDKRILTIRRFKKELTKAGKKHGSIIGPDLLPIPIENTIPPVLHITLGIVLRLFNKLLAVCRGLDKPATPNSLHELDREWEKKSFELCETQELLRGLGRNFVDHRNHLERLEALTQDDQGELERVARDSVICDSAISDDFEKCGEISCVGTRWDWNLVHIFCDSCKVWYHMMCEGIVTADYKTIKGASKYKCLRCQFPNLRNTGVHAFNTHVKSKMDAVLAEQEILNSLELELTSECEQLKCQVETMVGDYEKRLLNTLSEIGVERQAYHGNVFVGNHCKIILRKYDALLRVISGNKDISHKVEGFAKVFEVFGLAHEKMSAKRKLLPEEIQQLEDFCYQFGRLYPVYFPESPCLTRKMHALIFDVPRFAKRHGSVGLYSEEEGECLHKIVKKYRRDLCSIRKPGEQLTLIHKQLELAGRGDRTLAEPKRRKCRECNRFFHGRLSPCACVTEC